MNTNPMMPAGYNPAKHDNLDAMDAASDIADLTWDGDDEALLDVYIMQLARRITSVRTGR
jgi:hypothetical protein